MKSETQFKQHRKVQDIENYTLTGLHYLEI